LDFKCNLYGSTPWAHRLPVFEHYRGESFAIPKSSPGLKAYHAWLAAMEARPAVAKTCPPWDDYLQHIGGGGLYKLNPVVTVSTLEPIK
jgi:hypothetical protein